MPLIPLARSSVLPLCPPNQPLLFLAVELGVSEMPRSSLPEPCIVSEVRVAAVAQGGKMDSVRLELFCWLVQPETWRF